ncbi:uncharacterized protein LOC121526132 isoform X4 [Tachysurus ichikawai]
MEQMDIIVCYWCDREEKVAVRYFEFMGHTQAEKLLEKIKKTLSPLDPNKLLQIPLDGPMVSSKKTKANQTLLPQSCCIWEAVLCMLCMEAFKVERKKQTAEAIFGKIPDRRSNGSFFCKGAPVNHKWLDIKLYQKGRTGKVKAPLQLLKLDPQDKANHVPLKQLNTGFGTKQALEKASENLQDHPLKIQQFTKEGISFLSMTCKKMMERSPLMFPVVRHLSSLDPVAMVANGESSREMFQKLLQNWLNAGSISKFLGNLIRPEYTALWDLIKHLLTLSHGQGAVERGYSINKDMLVENLKERSLVALRMVQDAMAEHLLDEVLPRDLILHCKGARMRYVQ